MAFSIPFGTEIYLIGSKLQKRHGN